MLTFYILFICAEVPILQSFCEIRYKKHSPTAKVCPCLQGITRKNVVFLHLTKLDKMWILFITEDRMIIRMNMH
jgi:hypothetical protein